jgi:hypothetical protein
VSEVVIDRLSRDDGWNRLRASVGRLTPHPGATLTESAVMARSVGEFPATYIKCLLDSPGPSDTVAEP